MKKTIICLANSKKYGERCIAGIEVSNNENLEYTIVKKDNKPKWIRPVSGEKTGQVPAYLVENINLLDIVEFEVIEEVPNAYQSENIRFAPDSLQVVGKYKHVSDYLDVLTDQSQFNLFGNKGKAIYQDAIEKIDHSLTLIKVNLSFVYIRKEFNKEQFRLKFSFNATEYDLPITDVKFLEYCKNSDYSVFIDEILTHDMYLAISLGIEHEGWYYKLVAGIISNP